MRSKAKNKNCQFQQRQSQQQKKVKWAADKARYNQNEEKRKLWFASRKCRSGNIEDLRQQMELVFSHMVQLFPKEFSQGLTVDWAFGVILEWLGCGDWDYAKLLSLRTKVLNLSQNLLEVGFDQCKLEDLCQKIEVKLYYAILIHRVTDGMGRISYSTS